MGSKQYLSFNGVTEKWLTMTSLPFLKFALKRPILTKACLNQETAVLPPLFSFSTCLNVLDVLWRHKLQLRLRDCLKRIIIINKLSYEKFLKDISNINVKLNIRATDLNVEINEVGVVTDIGLHEGVHACSHVIVIPSVESRVMRISHTLAWCESCWNINKWFLCYCLLCSKHFNVCFFFVYWANFRFASTFYYYGKMYSSKILYHTK